MGLDQLAEYIGKEQAYIGDLLLKEGIENLADACEEIGIQKQCDLVYKEKYKSMTRLFLAGNKTRRRMFLEGLGDDIVRRTFLIAVAFEIRCAEAYAETLQKYDPIPRLGQAKTSSLLQYAAAAQSLQESYPSLWPFQDHDPFDEG